MAMMCFVLIVLAGFGFAIPVDRLIQAGKLDGVGKAVYGFFSRIEKKLCSEVKFE